MNEITDPAISPNLVPASFSNIPANLTQKGIYFWFADEEGLEKLLKPLSCKVIDRYFITHNGKKLFLIYIGTAGTGKQKKSHLLDRLKWHLTQRHTDSEVDSGTLSTFRLALAILLGTEVRGELARELVDNYIVRHLYLSWSTYENLDEIDSTEIKLIQAYRPTINLKNNPNKKVKGTATDEYSQLRAEHNKTLPKKKKASKKETKMSIKTTQNDRGCIEIPFSVQDNLHHKIQNIEGLGGKVSCTLYDSQDPNLSIYIQDNGNIWRSTGNIYNYFQNPDTTRGNISKHILVQKEMSDRGIKNAILKICPQDNSATNVAKAAPKPKISSGGGVTKIPVSLEDIDFEKMKNEPKLLILPCSDSKIPGGEDLPPEEKIDTFGGNADLGEFRQARQEFLEQKMVTKPNSFIKTRNGETVTVEYFQDALINGPYLPAIERYSSGILYNNGVHHQIVNMVASKDLKVLFVSAYYGILEYNDHIIDYHLVLNGNGFPKKNLNIIQNQIDDYRISNEIKESNVFALLNKAYSSVLSQNFSNLWINVHNGTADLYENKPILENFLNNL